MMCNIHFCPCHFKDSAAIRSKYPTNASLAVFNRTWGDINVYGTVQNSKASLRWGSGQTSYGYNEYVYKTIGNITTTDLIEPVPLYFVNQSNLVLNSDYFDSF